MKNERRAKRTTSKLSIMGHILKSLSRRDRRANVKRIESVQLAEKAPRQSFSLEAIEPRLLMAADVSFSLANIAGANNITIGAHKGGADFFIDVTGDVLLGPVSTKLTAGDTYIDIEDLTGATGQDIVTFDMAALSSLSGLVGPADTLTIEYKGGSELGFDDHITIDGKNSNLDFNLKLRSTADITAQNKLTSTADLTLSSDDSVTGNASTDLSAKNLTLEAIPVKNGGLFGTGILGEADSAITLTGSHLTASQTLTLDSHAKFTVTTTGNDVSLIHGTIITSFSDATVDIKGASVLSGNAVVITAFVDGQLTASAAGNTVKVVEITGAAAPAVTIGGSAQITAATNLTVTAKSDVQISATTKPGAANNNAKLDAAIVNTNYDSGAVLSVTGTSTLTATAGLASLTASSKLVSTAVADADVVGTAGAALAVQVVWGDTTATVSGASAVSRPTLAGNAVTIAAITDRNLTTTAKSAPGGADASGAGTNKSETALKDNKASTSAGKLELAGAIAISTDLGTTEASLINTIVDAGAGAATVSASSTDITAVTATGEATKSAATGVGVAVAIGVADRDDLAHIGGTTGVTAGTLDVAVLAPAPSSFLAQATSGVGDSTKLGVAGSLAINVTVFEHKAFLDAGSTLTLTGSPDVTIESHVNLSNTAKALPSSGGGNSDNVGIGASVAVNYGEDLNSATIGNSATLTGTKNLTLNADGSHEMDTEATGGGAGKTAVTPIVAISISANDSLAQVGTGAALGIGGDFLASSTLSNVVTTAAEGDTKATKTGVGISFALSVVNDHSTATTLRNLTASAGAVAFLSNTLTNSRSSAKAGVGGGEADDGPGGKDQQVDKNTSDQTSFGDQTATDQVAKNGGAATKGSQGKSAPSASTSGGKVSVAGAVGINVAFGTSTAYIGDGLAVTTGTDKALTLHSTANVDGAAEADGSAVVGAIVVPQANVNTTNDTVNFGSNSGLTNGAKVTLVHGGIEGLTDDNDYYVRETAANSGLFKLYASEADANSDSNKIDLKSVSGSSEFKGVGKGGTSVGAAIAVNYEEEINLAYIGSSTIHAGGSMSRPRRAFGT